MQRSLLPRPVVSSCFRPRMLGLGQYGVVAAAAEGRTGGRPAQKRGGGGAGRRGYRAGQQQRGGRQENCDAGRLEQQRRQEPVRFTAPFPQDPLVGIIGGGLSGLVCAIELAQRGVRSVVFDTGEHGVGGRLATRAEADGSLPGAPAGVAGLVFDHAAQYFTASDPAFQGMVERWEAGGAVRRWTGRVGELQRGGAFTVLPRHGQPRYVATGGMRSLARYLGAQASQALQRAQGGSDGGRSMEGMVEVRRPQWVSDMVPARADSAWRLVGRGREQGMFDAVVIAHNGKCANRLVQPAGVPQVFSQLRRLKLSANWVLMVAFAQPLALGAAPWEGAFIQGSDTLAWAANNTAKLGLQQATPAGVECWTLISTQQYGRSNKVPQENVPDEVRQRVTAEMLDEFAACLGLPRSALPPLVYTRVQLWGAALPLNSPNVPCIWDPHGRVGVCGDWVAGGGSMQAAALSGRALAERICAMRGLDAEQVGGLAEGLADPLTACDGEQMGQFPQPRKADKAVAAAVVPA